MKSFVKNLRLLAMLFAIMILFQSCRVYKHAPVSIDDAVKSEKRVKIKTIDNTKLKFKKLVYEDGIYYGIKRIDGHLEKISIDPKTIDNVRAHNKTMSIIYGVLWPITATYAVGLIALASLDFNVGSGLTFPN